MSKNECVSEGLLQNQVGELAPKKRKLKISYIYKTAQMEIYEAIGLLKLFFIEYTAPLPL